MAKATNTPSADKKPKVVHRLRLNELALSIGDGRNFSIQRTYVYNGKAGYSNWLRSKDLEDMKLLLDNYAKWCEEHPVESTADQADK